MRYITNTYTIANTNGQATHTVAIDLSGMIAASAQGKFSDSSAAGTMKFQVSNDPPAATGGGTPAVPTNWSDLSGSSATIASGALAFIPKVDISYNWLQVVFTSTGGAGTIAISIKTVGY